MTPNYFFANKYLGNSNNSNNMSIWSGIAGAAGGLLGGVMNEAFSDKHLKDAQNFALMQGDIDWQRQRDAFNMTNQRDDQVWNRQKEYNEYLWNKQNAYNSPSAQMDRYKEAGLNPHLIYGQSNAGGSIATANLGSAQHGSSGGHSPVQAKGADWSFIGSVLSQYNDLRLQSAQIDNVKAATEATRVRAGVDQIRQAAVKAGIPGIEGRSLTDLYRGQNVASLLQYQYDHMDLMNKKAYQDIDLGLQKFKLDSAKTKALLENLGIRTEGEGIRNKMNQLRYERESVGEPFDLLLKRYGGVLLQKLIDLIGE